MRPTPMQTAHKVLVALVIITAASFWAMGGSSGTDPYRDVHEVAADADAFAAGPVTVKGNVVAGSITADDDEVRFLLADASGDPAYADTALRVVYAGPLPEAFGPKMVVVTGVLVDLADGTTVQATNIQVGCSSKY